MKPVVVLETFNLVWTILMAQKLQFSGRHSRHRLALFDQDLETVVHPYSLVLQLLILCKADQLAENDDVWLSDCSDVLEHHPQVVDQRIDIQVTNVILAILK